MVADTPTHATVAPLEQEQYLSHLHLSAQESVCSRCLSSAKDRISSSCIYRDTAGHWEAVSFPGHSLGGLLGAMPRAEPTGPHTRLNINSLLCRPNFQSPLHSLRWRESAQLGISSPRGGRGCTLAPVRAHLTLRQSLIPWGCSYGKPTRRFLLPCPATETLMAKPNKKNKHRRCILFIQPW